MSWFTMPTVICTCPPSRSFTAGAAPLYGTCSKSVFVTDLNISASRCYGLPGPLDA